MGILIAISCFVLSLLMIQRLNFCINSEDLLFSWNDQVDFLSILKYVTFEIKTNRILQSMTILIFIVCFRFKLEFFESLSIFTLSLVLKTIYNLIKMNFELAGKLNQYAIMNSTGTSPFRLFSSSSWSIASLLDKLVIIVMIVAFICNRVFIDLLHKEDKYIEALILVLLAIMFAKIFTSGEKVTTFYNKLWLAEKLVLIGLIVCILPYFNLLNIEHIQNSWIQPFVSSSIIKTFIPVFVFAQRVYVKVEHFDQKGNQQPLTRGLLLLSLFLVCLNYIIPVFVSDYYLPCKIVIPLIIYGLLLTTFGVSLRNRFMRGPSKKNNSDKESFYISNQLCLLMFTFLLVGNGAVAAFVLVYTALQLITGYFVDTNPESLSYPFIVAALGYFGYFCTGHSNLLHNLQYPQAYIGFYKFNFVTSGLLLSTNTYSTFFLAFMFLMNMAKHLHSKKESQIRMEVKEVNHQMHEAKANTYKNMVWLRNTFVFATILSLAFAINSYNCIKYYNGIEFLGEFSPKYILDTTAYATVSICVALLSS